LRHCPSPRRYCYRYCLVSLALHFRLLMIDCLHELTNNLFYCSYLYQESHLLFRRDSIASQVR
jgi:hypothetical protein